jgi:hypothetical protein
MPNQTKFFGPLLNGTYNDQNIRVSDAERQAVADRLAVHYADGRLDQAEFDERVGQAMSAKTRGDLRGLLDDLPEPGPTGAPGTVTAPSAATVSRHRHRHPVVLVALLVVAIVASAHAAWWFVTPGLWLAVIVLVALAVAGHHHHHQP